MYVNLTQNGDNSHTAVLTNRSRVSIKMNEKLEESKYKMYTWYQ